MIHPGLIALQALRPRLFPDDLLRAGVEPGDWPVRLPKLDVVAVDEPACGLDGGVVVVTVDLNDADGPIVQTNDERAIDRHFGLQANRLRHMVDEGSPGR